MNLTGYQVKQLCAFMGGDFDTEVTIEQCKVRKSTDGEHMPAGLYLWCTEYPEEGCVLLRKFPRQRAEVKSSGQETQPKRSTPQEHTVPSDAKLDTERVIDEFYRTGAIADKAVPSVEGVPAPPTTPSGCGKDKCEMGADGYCARCHAAAYPGY